MPENSEMTLENAAIGRENKSPVEQINESSQLEHLRMVRAGFIQTGQFDSITAMDNFARSLRANYPDADQHKLFHVLIGSTPPESCKSFDFPQPDSVATFIERLD